MKFLRYLIPAGLLLPLFASAQSSIDDNPLAKFLRAIIEFINDIVVPLVFALAFVAFLWGIFQYFILGGADEEKRAEGRSFAIWGIIAFFVMVSIWGIVNLLVSSFSFDERAPNTPTFGEPRQRSGDLDLGAPYDSKKCPPDTECIPGTSIPAGHEDVGL
ncbi:MAG TPA: pilin [Candidatus Paceibacterota bacterium]|nr:pilin [Candidatus Paceibacterota bacterium]